MARVKSNKYQINVDQIHEGKSNQVKSKQYIITKQNLQRIFSITAKGIGHPKRSYSL